MFGLFDDVVKGVVNLAADVVSPVTSLVGVDKSTIIKLAALGLTVYEISELTGIATDVVKTVIKE